MPNKNSFQEEFHKSKLYQKIGDDGKRIADDVFHTVDSVANEIRNEFTDNKKNANPYSVNGKYRQDHPYQQSGSKWTDPPKVNPVYTQAPPKPQKPINVNVETLSKKDKNKKQKKEKTKHHLPALYGILVASSYALPFFYLPFGQESILQMLATAVIGISSTYLLHAIFKIRTKKIPEKTVEKIPSKSNTGNSELDKIIDDGTNYIMKLKEANDAIAHEKISDAIERMENVSFDIFSFIKKNPEKIPQIKKFMNYYLPTTLTLLENYQTLNAQSVKGENILNTMHEIEYMMYTVAKAFENQLDSLFSQNAMNIGVDITVFDNILEQDGLKNENKKQL